MPVSEMMTPISIVVGERDDKPTLGVKVDDDGVLSDGIVRQLLSYLPHLQC